MALLKEHLTRQLDLIPLESLSVPVTIIGAGAIGSWVALTLAKMGMEDIEVWDFDKVDTVNLNSQFYRRSDVEQLKVAALMDMVKQFTGVNINGIAKPYSGAERFGGIVIAAVDSMKVRKTIWDVHSGQAVACKAIIDPRMGAETAHLYVMNPMDPADDESYRKTLYSDDEAVQERCTAKATVYTASLLGGLVVKAVKDLITRSPYARITRWNIGANAYESWGKVDWDSQQKT